MKPTLLVLHVTLLTGSCFCQSALNVSQLHEDLLTLNPNVRPVSNMSESTEVNITFQLISIVNLDTASQKMTSNGWMSVYWMNHYMTWDPEDYGGVPTITPLSEKMWRPSLTMMNSLKELEPMGDGFVTMSLQSNGLVIWYPAERFETFCEVDITYFPMDVQRCKWELFSWGYGVADVTLNAALPYIKMDAYQENGEWDLVESRAWTEVLTYDDNPTSFLLFEVTLRRRPVLLALTIVLPIAVLAVVNVFVFIIPSESGERLTYSMTAFLTFGVFMSYIVDILPSTAKTLSLLALYLSGQLIFSALYVLLCILSLRVFHRDSMKHPVPPFLQTVIITLEMLMCLDPPSEGHISSAQGATATDDSAGIVGAEVKGSRLKGQLDRWARKRKEKQEAHSQPQDMTWQRVSRTLDKLLFRVFFALNVLIVVAVTAMTAYQYTDIV